MKLMHLADIHLGKTLRGVDLTDDHEYILNQVIEIAKEEQVDGVIIAGDVYDRPQASETATEMLDDFLNRLMEIGLKVYLIRGNHDSAKRLQFAHRLFKKHGVHIVTTFDGELYKCTENDEYGDINIYLLPYVEAAYVREQFPDENIQSYEDAVRTIIQKAEIDTSKRNIIVSHQFVIKKGKDIEFSGSEGHSVKMARAIDEISEEVFDDFDYVALGHIHAPQPVGKKTVRYAGSILKFNLQEADYRKVVPIVTIGEKGNVDVKEVTLHPKRDLRHITGSIEELLAKDNIHDTDDYIYATLTDEDKIENVMSVFQQYYPNTVFVDYKNTHTPTDVDIASLKFEDKKPFDELIREFYSTMYGVEIDEEEFEYVMNIAKEVGALDETN